MRPSTTRPSTPPLCAGLLTPPSTGGYLKRELFPHPQEPCSNFKRKAKAISQEWEEQALTGLLEDCNEGLDIGDSEESTARRSTTDSSSVTTDAESSTGASSSSQVSHKPDGTTTATKGTFGISEPCITATSCAPESFPFMELSFSVRNEIYEHLLVIPGIICVRQKHTSFHHDRKAYLYAERRELLPGIAYALAQIKVDGFKTRFSRFASVNLGILRTSKEVFNEARAVMYGRNDFEIVKPTDELTPQPDFSIPLFPAGYQRIVTRLIVRIRTFYDLHWLLSGGYNVIRNYYRGLSTLTLILEIESATKGFGHQWSRQKSEDWVTYVKRLQSKLADDLFDTARSNKNTIPTCLDLRVLFSGETYSGSSTVLVNTADNIMTNSVEVEQAKREELRSALVESWELFKKGGK